jgi:iron(III) transport system substrate-binding protein
MYRPAPPFSGALRIGLVLVAIATVAACGRQDSAPEQVLNVYSARHYQSDEALYEAFTRETGIEVRRIEGGDDALIERITQEGDASPADVLITVDAGRLWRAQQAGLFQPAESAVLTGRIPAHLREPDGHWFGFSTRARIIFYNRERIDPAGLDGYEDLADPMWKGEVCARSGGNIYNLSLMASMIAHHGAEKAEAWARGVVENFARDPQGGDTDQIRAVAAGECGIAVANSYYFARLMNSNDPVDQAVVGKVGWIFPNQDDRGAHINVSGAGVIKHAPHPAAALAFLEFLASAEAQTRFAQANNEYPVVAGAKLDNRALETLGDFRRDELDASLYGEHQAEAQRAIDRAGWK